MIVRDEEQTIERVLSDCRLFCEEMIVVDTGSTDSTAQIASALGATVSHFEWIDDFAAARNAAFEACTQDWILWLDADDRLPQVVQERMRDVWRNRLAETEADAVFVPYRVWSVDGTGDPLLSYHRERLIRRAAGLRWGCAVHEAIDVPAGKGIIADDIWVEHRPLPEKLEGKQDRNLRILERMYAENPRDGRTLFYYGNELRDHGRFDEAIAVYEQYFKGAAIGWERYTAHLRMAQCLYRVDRKDDAAAEYLVAIQEDSSRAEAFIQLGVLHYEAGRWANAVPLLLAATACMPPALGFVELPDYQYRAWDYLAVCYWRLGKNEEALAALGKGARGNPDVERLAENARWILGDLRSA